MNCLEKLFQTRALVVGQGTGLRVAARRVDAHIVIGGRHFWDAGRRVGCDAQVLLTSDPGEARQVQRRAGMLRDQPEALSQLSKARFVVGIRREATLAR